MCLSHPLYDATTFSPAPFYGNHNINMFLWRTTILFRAFLFAGIFTLDHNIHVILNMIVLIMYHAWLITDSTLTSPLSLQVILNVVSYITWYIYHAWLITDSTLTSPLSLSLSRNLHHVFDDAHVCPGTSRDGNMRSKRQEDLAEIPFDQCVLRLTRESQGRIYFRHGV